MGKQYLKHLTKNKMRDGMRDEEIAAWARGQLRKRRINALLLGLPGLVVLVAAAVIRIAS